MSKMIHNLKLILILCFLYCSEVFSLGLSQELSGSIIYYDQRNQSENVSAAKAFDNNLDTYFKSDGTFGNWLGLDLGSPHIITSVDFYCRRDNKPEEYAARLELGIFEGANSPDFGDAIALAIISSPPVTGKNTINISTSKGFRYVRFLFPSEDKPSGNGLSKYMGELKFFGYQGIGNSTKLPTLTNLPTVNIHTVNAENITSKEVYIKGIVSFVYDDGTKFYTDSLQIRGRGNNSWTHPKKPYRMKLFNSVKLMGLPAKGKNWTLINNYGDKTLMRNILAFDFARRLEMTYVSPAIAVDVVLNGDYKGCYQLCDHIDVRKNRVDVEEMTPFDLTGGYLIEIDAYASAEPKKFTSNQYRIPVSIKYPDDDEITPAQESYIAEQFNKLTNAVSASNFKDPFNGYQKYLDIESFLRHFLVGEFSGNTDTYWSVRMSKKKDDDKFYIGPVWDFDLAFENDWRTYPLIQNAQNRGNEWMALWNGGTSAAGNTKDMLRRIFTDSSANQRLKDIYAEYRDENKISKTLLETVVDSCENLLINSQNLNFKRWPIMLTKVHENPVIYGSYVSEVDNVRSYINQRMDWLDSKLAYVPNSTNYDQYEDMNVVIGSLNNILYISNLPQNSILKIVDVMGVVYANNVCDEKFSIGLRNGIYIISVKDGSREFTFKHIIR
ncbi:hypothetical protein MASR2M117_07720 [Paludibacter sp.]